MFSNFTELSKAMEKSGERSGKFMQYVCPPVRLGSYPPVAARRAPLEALNGERRRQTNMQRKARKQVAGEAAAAAARRTGGVAPSVNSAPASSVRRRKLQHPVAEWIMSPCQNFEQDSDSEAEHKLPQSSSRLLSAVVSRRQLESRTYIVPSQRIMEVAALKKAQVWPLLAKKERLEQQTMAQQVETQPLDETRIESEVLVESELELTIGQTHSSRSRSKTSVSSQPQEAEEQQARAWSKVRLIPDSSKAIRLTSTVVKIIPNAPKTDAKAKAGSRKQQAANADPFEEEPTSVLPLKPPPSDQRLSRSCPPKSTKKMPGPRPKLNQVSMARPQSQSQSQQQSAAPAATVAPSMNSKIVRMAQHKVPRTAEDGIDMSYQYFVSIPLKRGKKPHAVRYLHQSLVKSLNPTVRHTCGKRIKKKKSQQCEKQAEMDENPLEAAETEAEPELGPEEELEAKPFKEPTLKLERKYMPMLQLLSQIPYPAETETEPEPQPKEDLQETTKDILEAQGDHQVAKSNRQLAGTDREVPGAKPKKCRTSLRLFPPIHSVLVDFKREATRLESIAGAQICYHTPVRFLRRLAGGEAHKLSTSPADAQRQQKEHTEQPMDKVERVQKSVSFQSSETKSSSSIRLTELKIDVPEPEPVPVPVPVPAPVRGQSKSPKKLASSKKQTKSTNKMKKFATK
ncbi:uncharacterized protein LOC117581569 [Drosophila guanche]|uniref:Uncharacterized protein n=1 Tax=Drosophila guanche TaxID=7266 RepID=A0A3B0J835_DROGU|nr:uncharacterized protein LOC117581569 [Drosophila guanche]SPP78464.1 Hypothetical predicted protein [Drosophila guanche]